MARKKRPDAAAPPDPPAAREIAVDLIDPSPLNRRCADDDQGILDLAASIRELGQLSAIAVRPNGGGRYEIIYGERRWRACRSMGAKTISCVVKDIDEQRAQAERITENLLRQDLTPMEEGEGVKALLELHGNDHSEVAARIGYSETWIRRRARLPNLVPAWREAIADPDGPYAKIAASIEKVEEIAILPADTQEALLAERVLAHVATTGDMRKRLAAWFRDLDAKPWRDDWEKGAYRTPRRCRNCVKRSDRERTLFAGIHGEAENGGKVFCLDPKCWEEHLALWCNHLLAENLGSVTLWDGYVSPAGEQWAREQFHAKPLSRWEWEACGGDEPPDGDFTEKGVGVFVGGARAGTVVPVWIRRDEGDDETDGRLRESRERRQELFEARRQWAEAVRKELEERIPDGYSDAEAAGESPDDPFFPMFFTLCAWFGILPQRHEDEYAGLAMRDVHAAMLKAAWSEVRGDALDFLMEKAGGDRSTEADAAIADWLERRFGIDVSAILAEHPKPEGED